MTYRTSDLGEVVRLRQWQGARRLSDRPFRRALYASSASVCWLAWWVPQPVVLA